MTVDVLAAREAHRQKTDEELVGLRKIRARNAKKETSEQARVRAEIVAFLEWEQDARPAFADDGNDKFAGLIELARNHEGCTAFFTKDVGVNLSTVWRWASEKSRPSKYVARHVSEDTRAKIIEVLWTKAFECGMISALVDA